MQTNYRTQKKCLQSLSKVTYGNLEIILVDNASVDNTVSYVKNHFPKVKIIENKKNLGFCGGNNQGFEKSNGKYIFFLNNDTEVKPDFIEILIDRMENNPMIGAIQPKMRQLVEKDKLDACASYLTPTGFLYHFGYSQDQNDKRYNNSFTMYSVKGAGFMAPRKLIKKIGLFDEDFFAYFEETDFCHRVWMSGNKVVYEPKSEIFHLGGGDKKNDHPESLQYISYRNRIQSYLKNLELKYLLKIMLVHVVLCLVAVVVFLLLRKPGISISIIRAIGWNIFNFNKILRKRRIIQRNIRKVPEKIYIKEIMRNPGLSYYYHFFSKPRSNFNYINSSTD